MADRKTPREMLQCIGETLHGNERWRMRLSRDAGVSDDTVRRWFNGGINLPEDHEIFSDLLQVIREKNKALADMESELAEWLGRDRQRIQK